jgi:hypothetical protein
LVGAPKPDGSTIYAQHDALPCGGAYPAWQPGEVIIETYRLALPSDLPPGEFALNIGWYNETSGERLPVVDEAGQPAADNLLLESLQIGLP